MIECSRVDLTTSPPSLTIPRVYNAAYDLIESNLAAGRADKIAFVDDNTELSYAMLSKRVDRFASALLRAGLRQEERILLCMHDTVDWPVAFLGAIKAGIVPVCVNTLLTASDYAFMVADSRARYAFVSSPVLAQFDGLVASTDSLEAIIEVAGSPDQNHDSDYFSWREQAAGDEGFDAVASCADQACFWLYSSGSTGQPKGTVHVHASLMQTAHLYGKQVLGITESDVVFSAAKLFFAYGLGNGLTFPMAVGATALLMPERPTPAAVFKRFTGKYQPSVFYGVPTLFAGMLASDDFPALDKLAIRVCTSAGEPLPEHLGNRFSTRCGAEILDGIGSTEMLHIFLSNRPGRVRYGTTGEVVPGYELKILDENEQEVADGEIGDLYIKGPSAASMYWNQRTKTRATFLGEWTRSGDKYIRSADGYYTYSGRSDDMLKVSGQYVSPFEVESALAAHDAVLEAAVVAGQDEQGLIKPKAFIVLQAGSQADEQTVADLKAFVKQKLAPFKYPRWIEFVDELPKTATGKVQRFKLRA